MKNCKCKYTYVHFISLFIFFILLFIIISYLYLNPSLKENFNNQSLAGINSFVILMPNDTRIKNIEMNKSKLGGIPLNIYNAVIGKDIDINQLKFDEGKLDNLFIRDTPRRKNQLGCYLSHRDIIYNIMTNKNYRDNYEYSIIFEDDMRIDCKNLENEVIKILDSLESKRIYDFDIIFLGNLNKNHGEHIANNVYKLDSNNRLWGTQGYLVKNFNIEKIYNKIRKMNMPIDNKYELLLRRRELNGYVIYPYLVSQNGMKSQINI